MEKVIDEKIKEIDNCLMKKLFSYLLDNQQCKVEMADYIKAYTLCNEMIKNTSAVPIDKLYLFIKKQVEYFIGVVYKKVRQEENTPNFLTSFHKETGNTKILICWLERIFNSLSKIKDVKITLFTIETYREKFMVPLKKALFEHLNNEIIFDREGKTANRIFIRDLTQIIENCEIEDPEIKKDGDEILICGKEKVLKTHLLTDAPSKKYYSVSSKKILGEWMETQLKSLTLFVSKKASDEIKVLNSSEYVSSALKYCIDEDTRKSIYLPKEIHKRQDDINYRKLIMDNVETIKESPSGLGFMMESHKRGDLKNVFDLFIRYPESLKAVMDVLKNFIVSKGEDIYKNQDVTKDPTKFIPALITIKNDIDSLVSECFQDNYQILDCKSKAFTKLMQKEHYSKQLSNYLDFLMKTKFKSSNDDQIETELKNVINIFRCITNKLLFGEEYVKKLSERMLNQKAGNIHAEKNFISKLRAEQGITYVNRMTKIFEDLDKSIAAVDKFRSQNHKGFPGGVQMSCQILENGAWYIDPMREFKFIYKTISPKLELCRVKWEEYYKGYQNSHKLQWVYGAVKDYYIYIYIFLDILLFINTSFFIPYILNRVTLKLKPITSKRNSLLY